MKVRKWLAFFAGIGILLLTVGCKGEPVAEASIAVEQKTAIENSEEILRDDQSATETVDWQMAVGEWEDENGLGYTMHVSINESATDALFSICFMPHGGVFLNWVLPCKLDGEVLHYDRGVMNFTEIAADENGEPMVDSSVEKELIGSFSFDSSQDVLSWCDGSDTDGNLTNFVRSQSAGNAFSETGNDFDEMMINGIPYAVADADGWGEAWQAIAEIIRNGTDSYFKEAEADPSLYGSGNAWDDITVEGITYEMADKHGWGDLWWEAADHFGSDYNSYNGEGYSGYLEPEYDSSTALGNAELIRINGPSSAQLAGEWKNAYNQSTSRNFRISGVHARNLFPTIERREQIAAVVTEVEFWFEKQGGSPAGSVYTVVMIDAMSGEVLSACITA